MLLWAGIAVLSAAVLAFVLRPLLSAAQPAPESHAAAVYRDQLLEIDAELERGLLASEEAEAAQAIKACLLDGRGGVAFTIELLPKFAWMVAVNGVTAAWPELTAGFRTQLFSGLAKEEADTARRPSSWRVIASTNPVGEQASTGSGDTATPASSTAMTVREPRQSTATSARMASRTSSPIDSPVAISNRLTTATAFVKVMA